MIYSMKYRVTYLQGVQCDVQCDVHCDIHCDVHCDVQCGVHYGKKYTRERSHMYIRTFHCSMRGPPHTPFTTGPLTTQSW